MEEETKVTAAESASDAAEASAASSEQPNAGDVAPVSQPVEEPAAPPVEG